MRVGCITVCAFVGGLQISSQILGARLKLVHGRVRDADTTPPLARTPVICLGDDVSVAANVIVTCHAIPHFHSTILC